MIVGLLTPVRDLSQVPKTHGGHHLSFALTPTSSHRQARSAWAKILEGGGTHPMTSSDMLSSQEWRIARSAEAWKLAAERSLD